jgi:GTP 3',8-cyclase
MKNTKILQSKILIQTTAKLKKSGKKIVYTQGYFDLLHAGHIHNLEQAKKQGNILIVGVNSDRFMKKGLGRPFFKQEQRIKFIAALECVDFVVLNDADDAVGIIKKIAPDVYAKGGDVKEKAANPKENLYKEIKALENKGGKIYFTEPLEAGGMPIHSTQLLNDFSKGKSKTEHSKVDSHKMTMHPGWVAKWQEGRSNWEKAKLIYPLQVEISPAGMCNHRCAFCALDFVGYKPEVLPKKVMEETLTHMSHGGVRSVMFGGEGEPCMNPHLADIIVSAKKLGLDSALTTNGSLMNGKFLDKALGRLSWIKVSIAAGEKETYLKIQRPKNPGDFENVFANLKLAVKLKAEKNYNCRIGAQVLLLPEAGDKNKNSKNKKEKIPSNFHEIITLAEKLKVIGLDYFVVKPYSHQPLSLTKFYKDVDYNDYTYQISWLKGELQKIATKNFEIILRSNAMEKYSQERTYGLCGSTPFAWAYIMADGSVYNCSAHLLDKRFYLGNIKNNSFKEIWEGEERKKQWQMMKNFDPKNCRKNCVMDKVNEYLWEITHPPYNVNFI